jgi:group I intron endonuclease
VYLIYFICNTVTDCVYVGQTKEHATRLRRHKYHLAKGIHHSDYLQRAWDKYGAGAFVFYPVCEIESAEETDEVERLYINWFRALRLSYNMNAGGKTGGDLTPAGIEKLAAAARGNTNRKGSTHTEEARRKQSEAHTGKSLSEEHKAKSIEALSRRIFTEDYRRKLSEATKGNQNWLGKHHSEEMKRKMSEARKGEGNPAYGKPQSEESNRKRSETTKGRPGKPLTEEAKQKIREARAKQVMKPMSEETKEKIRQRALDRAAKKREAKEQRDT